MGDDRFPFGPNWAVLCLPYFEQDILYKQGKVSSYPGPAINDSNKNDPNNFGDYDLTWRIVRKTDLKVFVCPADSGHDEKFSPDIPGGMNASTAPKDPQTGDNVRNDGGRPESSYAGSDWSRGNYACNAGAAEYNHLVGGQSLPEDNGMPGVKAKSGGPMGVNWGAKLNAMANQDGTSNTMLLAEVRVGVNSRDRRGVWALGFPGSSVTCRTGRYYDNPNDFRADSDRIQDCSYLDGDAAADDLVFYAELAADGMGCKRGEHAPDWAPPIIRDEPNLYANARSRHTGGVNTCFADGSVRFLRNTVRRPIYFSMTSRNDGHHYHYDF